VATYNASILSGSQPQSSATQDESVQSNRTIEANEVSIKPEDGTPSSISSRYNTAGKDQEYRQSAVRLASEMKRKKALEQEVSDVKACLRTITVLILRFRHIEGRYNKYRRIERKSKIETHRNRKKDWWTIPKVVQHHRIRARMSNT
jgi:hypothetical protein